MMWEIRDREGKEAETKLILNQSNKPLLSQEFLGDFNRPIHGLDEVVIDQSLGLEP